MEWNHPIKRENKHKKNLNTIFIPPEFVTYRARAGSDSNI